MKYLQFEKNSGKLFEPFKKIRFTKMIHSSFSKFAWKEISGICVNWSGYFFFTETLWSEMFWNLKISMLCHVINQD